jgi:transglutaminase-like putative cysteine protease
VTATFLEAPIAQGAVEQRIHYDYSLPVRNLRQRLVVVPPPRHGRQRRGDWSFDVLGAEPETVRFGCDSFGNVKIEVVVAEVRSWIEFDVRAAIEFPDEPIAGVPADRRYLEPTRLTAADDAIALLVNGGDRTDPELICARVHQALTYEYGITGVHTTAADALSGGRGVCQDYAHLMLAVCRMVGLPARYVSGHLVGEGGSHAWVEVYRRNEDDPGTWIPEAWDPTHGRRTTSNYITIATGRDYSDVAPMSGTYDGRARGALSVTKSARTWFPANA